MDIKGLTAAEVRIREKNGLTNKAAAQKTKTYREIIVENIFSLFNFITFGIILFVLFFYIRNNDSRLLLDSIGIFFIALTNTVIALYQEIKSKISLDKVNLLLKKEITVIRDYKRTYIDQSNVVKDDIIEIRRGDQVIADGRVFLSQKMEIDESLLTGESIPILKSENDKVFSGSFCVSGGGFYIAEEVGTNSHAQQITNLAKKYKFILTPLQKKINIILKVLFTVAVILAGIEVIMWNYGITQNNNFTDHIRKIATILISLVPQGLILTASVTFVVGVYRISKIGAIIQKLNAIESFSNVQYVCMDKTGTLTENRLSVKTITPLNDNYNKEQIEKLLGTYAFLSTEKNATIKSIENLPKDTQAILLNEIPFSSDTKISIQELKTENSRIILILGAYDILNSYCVKSEQEKIATLFNEMQLYPYRNLLFGFVKNKTIEDLSSKELDTLLIDPLCIISISDTVRNDVYDAIRLFENNNIDFKILTGDSSDAVKAVLKDIGWKIENELMISGKEIENMNELEFDNCVLKMKVFSRLKPEHKLRIINSLMKRKLYTAMIGDGVNDLPAIKKAHIGIAMEEGSSITKEVADIILLKNKFSLLPEIFKEGNKIVNSVNSIAKLFLTKNFLVIYLTLASLFFLLEFPLTPRRVSLLNVFSIGLPAFLITMKNKNTNKCLNFTKDVFSFVITSTTIITICAYISYFGEISKYSSLSAKDMVMTTVIIVLAITNFLIVSKSSLTDKKIYYTYGISLILLFFILATIKVDFFIIKGLQIFYEIEHLSFSDWIISIIVIVAGSILLWIAHYFREKILFK